MVITPISVPNQGAARPALHKPAEHVSLPVICAPPSSDVVDFARSSLPPAALSPSTPHPFVKLETLGHTSRIIHSTSFLCRSWSAGAVVPGTAGSNTSRYPESCRSLVLTCRRPPLRALPRELRAHTCLAVASKTDSSQIRLRCLHEPWSLGDCRASTLSEPTPVCRPTGGYPEDGHDNAQGVL